MSQLLKKQIFGEIPEDFNALLIKACDYEPEAKRQHRPVSVLIIALCILLLAGTALAVVQGLKIVNFFGVGGVNEKEAELVIDTAVVQSGGTTSIADFFVSEAFYDGTFLRFVIDNNKKQEAVLLNAAFLMLQETEETSGLPGTRYGVETKVDCPSIEQDIYASMGYIGEDSLYVNSFFREETGLDSIDLSIAIDLLDIDDRSVVDRTILSFTVEKTATPITREYDLSFDTDYVRLEKVIIAKTPLEVIASLEYTPLLRAFGSFTIVPGDGYVVKDNRLYHFGNIGTIPDLANGGRMTMKYVLPVEQGMENVLMLWITNTNQAIEIHLDTGEAQVFTVAAVPEGDNLKIEKVEE